MRAMTMIAAVAVAMLAQACTAEVGTQPFQTEGKTEQALTKKTASYQGAWAMWETDMPCTGSAAWCTVTNGNVISYGFQPNGKFRCEANINPGQTLEMTLSCP